MGVGGAHGTAALEGLAPIALRVLRVRALTVRGSEIAIINNGLIDSSGNAVRAIAVRAIAIGDTGATTITIRGDLLGGTLDVYAQSTRNTDIANFWG